MNTAHNTISTLWPSLAICCQRGQWATMVLRGSISELHLYRWEVLLGCPTRAIARQWDNAESHPWREVVEVAECPWAAWACPWRLIWTAVGAAAGAPCLQESFLAAWAEEGDPCHQESSLEVAGEAAGGPAHTSLQSGLYKRFTQHNSACMCRALPCLELLCHLLLYCNVLSAAVPDWHHWTQVQHVCRSLGVEGARLLLKTAMYSNT